ncbi:MAG TPA: PPOX class F420-dependent oxidoreductase [Actinomycetota bacterium]
MDLSEHDVELLTGTNVGHFATIMADGSPQVSPIWVDSKDGLILVNTAEGRLKLRNVRRDPRVALSVVSKDDPYDVLIVQGRVVEITREGADAHIDKLVNRYEGKERFGRYRPERFLLKILPERISHRTS